MVTFQNPPSLLSLGNLSSPQNYGSGAGSLGGMNRFGNLNQNNFGRNRFNQTRDYGKRDVKVRILKIMDYIFM